MKLETMKTLAIICGGSLGAFAFLLEGTGGLAFYILGILAGAVGVALSVLPLRKV